MHLPGFFQLLQNLVNSFAAWLQQLLGTMQQQTIYSIYTQTGQGSGNLFFSPIIYISTTLRNCGQLGHQLEALRTHFTKAGFALAVGYGGIKGIDTLCCRKAQHGLCRGSGDLADLIGYAIGQAELGSAES